MAQANTQFPWKLHEILTAADKNGQDAIISWLPDGRKFRVHQRERFIEEIMKVQFKQTKFKSFQRQLNLWGFERIKESIKFHEKGAYFHMYFVKGNPELIHKMTRQKIKGAPKDKKADGEEEMEEEVPFASSSSSSSMSSSLALLGHPAASQPRSAVVSLGAAASSVLDAAAAQQRVDDILLGSQADRNIAQLLLTQSDRANQARALADIASVLQPRLMRPTTADIALPLHLGDIAAVQLQQQQREQALLNCLAVTTAARPATTAAVNPLLLAAAPRTATTVAAVETPSNLEQLLRTTLSSALSTSASPF